MTETLKSSTGTKSATKRTELPRQLFPRGIPKLWCPSLTHYTADSAIDSARIEAHLRFIVPHVKGFLIPGSTSDGWELNEKEFGEVVEIALTQAQELEFYLLIGVLKIDTGQ